MAVRSIPATRTTPAHAVTSTAAGTAVYVGDVFKGSVRPMLTPGFFAVRDADGQLVRNEADIDGLWTSERDALDFLARL